MTIKNRYKKNTKIFINYFLGPVLFVWVCYSIYTQLRHHPNLEASWQVTRAAMGTRLTWILATVFLLMLANWSVEAWKWRLSVQKIQRVSFYTAFKAVLSGVSFSVTTPNRVGEYLGRILYMEEGKRLKAISLTITGSLSQLMITLGMGLMGLVILRSSIEGSGMIPSIWIRVLIYGTFTVLVILTLFYFRLPWLVRWIDRLPGNNRFAWLIRTLEEFNATMLLQLLSLSALRFAIFILQYYLLFQLFGVNITAWQGLWTVSLSFLVMAVIPTIALFTDLGLRGEISLRLLGLFSENSIGIGLVSVTIWFINLIIPALAGSLLILSIKKIFKNKNEVIQ